MGSITVSSVRDWLIAGAPGASGPAAVLDRLCEDLLAAGVPLHRVGAYVRTLHPHIAGRSFLWTPGKRTEVREMPFSLLLTDRYRDSPLMPVSTTGQPLRRRLFGAEDDPEPRYPVLDELRAEGFTDYYAAPLPFLNGEVHAITFATREPGGLTDEHVAALEAIRQPLARIAEILALTRTAANLLDTYVGRNAGGRILAGKIHRGDTDAIHAVLWSSDLRGFTELASTVEAGALIRVLNDLFECQVGAIQQHGGEVLKFIGDGLLAIFPIEGGGRSESAACDAALDAAAEAYQALAALNDARTGRGEPPVRVGLALHVGDVAYGNIGGAGRLDFTCIGPAVNLAARLEGLTGRLGRPVVASEDFARRTTRRMDTAGEFELKGVASAQKVFVPAEGARLMSW
jgi:adenylate cyclase